MKFVTALLVVFSVVGPLFPQKTVKEEVAVNWWLFPVIAVDSSGDPVVDLIPEELTVRVNRSPVEAFTLYRRDVGVSEPEAVREERPPVRKRRILFFIFDTAFSSRTNLEKSKAVAVNIIRTSEIASLFVVMVIDPLNGLMHLEGPISDRAETIEVIEKKVNWSRYAKSIETIMKLWSHGQIAEGRNPKYTASGGSSEQDFRLEELAHALKNANHRYLKSFENLYHGLNSLKDHKLVYLFTQGISLFAQKVVRYSGGEYRHYIRKAAKFLGQSGALLFIINPAGATESYLALTSGEDSLRYFASESGGKYLEGVSENVAERIRIMNRAFYEIAFRDSGLGEEEFEIEIRCSRPGVVIHTLTHVARSKPFARLDTVEKEYAVVNLLSANPLYEPSLAVQDARMAETVERSGEIVCRVRVPENWREHELELYKGTLDTVTSKIDLEKTVITAHGKWLKIVFPDRENLRSGFLLVSPEAGAGLIRKFHAFLPAEPEAEPEIRPLSDDFVFNEAMPQILRGAADYCDRLKEAALHYVCEEKVVETFDLLAGGDDVSDISFYEDRASTQDMLDRNRRHRRLEVKKVNKFTFDYQLILNRGRIEETRKLLSDSEKKGRHTMLADRVQSFLAARPVFAPLTLLERSRQRRYEFHFIEYDTLRGRRFAVVEALPRQGADAQFVYGKIWIDTVDFSVARIEVNPVSIGRYSQLLHLARLMQARLFLSLEIEFDMNHRGIRFPTRILLSERYKGGPVILRARGQKGWERNQTEYSYKKYRFFTVDAEVLTPNILDS